MKNRFTLTAVTLCLESMTKIMAHYAQWLYSSSQADTVGRRCQCNGIFIKISFSAFVFRHITKIVKTMQLKESKH